MSPLLKPVIIVIRVFSAILTALVRKLQWLRKQGFASRQDLSLYIFPSRYTRSITLNLSRRALAMLSILPAAALTYCLITSFIAITAAYQSWSLTREQQRLQTLLSQYKEALTHFSLTAAPQEVYINNQLASWQGLPQAATGGVSEAWDGDPLALSEQVRAERQHAIHTATSNLTTLMQTDLSALQNNHRVMRELSYALGENKRFLAALPLSWPLLNGWGEQLPTQTLQKKSAATNFTYFKHPAPELRIHVLPSTPVIATANGTVLSVTPIPAHPFTWNIVLQHDYGIQTFYQQVQNPSVQPQALVRKQEIIGFTASHGSFTYKVKLAQSFISPENFVFIRY